ncbi:hypothetical protein [Sphingomonas turrisvirgatae]|uniref:Uncharacterized protein n=1 Tax=Sphingomonas turrisvirgatae TaxID=1888892 RepID=A0A1E3LWT9_9SPHN|nr:hypothetical protein [Sphingomonas turrisvirgatae]ODP38214.1 hypothetical protein BFL28_14635 [Sphingomonas turrisvirgatae]
MFSVVVALAIQAPVVADLPHSNSDRVRFVFASDAREVTLPVEQPSMPAEFTTRAYHDIVKRCGGKRLSAWQRGSRIVVSGISDQGNVELARCVEAATTGLSRIVVRNNVATPRPDNQDIQPLRTSPLHVR